MPKIPTILGFLFVPMVIYAMEWDPSRAEKEFSLEQRVQVRDRVVPFEVETLQYALKTNNYKFAKSLLERGVPLSGKLPNGQRLIDWVMDEKNGWDIKNVDLKLVFLVDREINKDRARRLRNWMNNKWLKYRFSKEPFYDEYWEHIKSVNN